MEKVVAATSVSAGGADAGVMKIAVALSPRWAGVVGDGLRVVRLGEVTAESSARVNGPNSGSQP